MGGRKKQLNALARGIWLWCKKRNLWLSVFHIPGIHNIHADQLSRAGKKLNQDMEWALDPNIFHEIQKKIGICSTDLFASAQNHKLPTRQQGSGNKCILINMEQWLKFCFSTFQLPCTDDSESCGRQSRVDSGGTSVSYTGLVPPSAETSFSRQLQLPKVDNLLYLYNKNKVHQLTTMRMVAFRLSENTTSVQEYQQKLPKSLFHHGWKVQLNNMGHISRDGCAFVVNKQIDVINQSVNNILNYLTMLHQGNLGYSSVNTAKSMLSSLVSLLHKKDIGQEPLI